VCACTALFMMHCIPNRSLLRSYDCFRAKAVCHHRYLSVLSPVASKFAVSAGRVGFFLPSTSLPTWQSRLLAVWRAAGITDLFQTGTSCSLAQPSWHAPGLVGMVWPTRGTRAHSMRRMIATSVACKSVSNMTRFLVVATSFS
jgi:hypothetical protein